MSDVGDVAVATTAITNMVDGILTRADRDAPEKEYNENLSKIQDAFSSNEREHDIDSDEFRIFIDRLYRTAGCPLTPTRDVPMGKREFTHASAVLAAQLIHERRLVSRLINKLGVKE